jgi:nitrate reductase NapAB chaperone NapD
MLIVAVLVGCSDGNPSAEIRTRAAELSSGFKTQAAEHHSKTIAVIESTSQEIVSQNEQIIDTLKIVEASLVESKSVRKEDDQQSALESQEPPRPNPSQSSKPVASAPAVRLSGPLKLSWNVEGNWNPSIIETAKHLREDHGIIADGMTHQQMHDAHAAAHEGRPVAMKSQSVRIVNQGTYCPNGQCPTSRQTVRMRWRR